MSLPVLLFAFVALQTAATPAPAPTPVAEKPICRAIGTTGSRLPKRKICHSRAEWAEIARDAGGGQLTSDTRLSGQN